MDSENIFSLNTNLKYVTLDHKTCPTGLVYFFWFIIDLTWINKLSIDVWFVKIGQYLLIYNSLKIWNLRGVKKI